MIRSPESVINHNNLVTEKLRQAKTMNVFYNDNYKQNTASGIQSGNDYTKSPSTKLNQTWGPGMVMQDNRQREAGNESRGQNGDGANNTNISSPNRNRRVLSANSQSRLLPTPGPLDWNQVTRMGGYSVLCDCCSPISAHVKNCNNSDENSHEIYDMSFRLRITLGVSKQQKLLNMYYKREIMRIL